MRFVDFSSRNDLLCQPARLSVLGTLVPGNTRTAWVTNPLFLTGSIWHILHIVDVPLTHLSVFHETNIAPQKMPSPKGSTSCSKHQFLFFFHLVVTFQGGVPTWSKRFSTSPRRQNVGETGCGHLYRDLKHCAHWAFGRWVGFAQGVEGSRL